MEIGQLIRKDLPPFAEHGDVRRRTRKRKNCLILWLLRHLFHFSQKTFPACDRAGGKKLRGFQIARHSRRSFAVQQGFKVLYLVLKVAKSGVRTFLPIFKPRLAPEIIDSFGAQFFGDASALKPGMLERPYGIGIILRRIRGCVVAYRLSLTHGDLTRFVFKIPAASKPPGLFKLPYFSKKSSPGLRFALATLFCS